MGISIEHAPGNHGAVPIGGIIMWSGTIATIPANWALCDGTANAPGPDLRNQFIVGASADNGGVAKTNLTGSLTQSGGSVSHHHANHSVTQPSNHSDHDSQGSHTHDNHGGSSANATTGISIGTSGAGSSHSHSGSADHNAHTHTGPSHQHNLTGGAATAHGHTYTDVVNHVHVQTVNSATTGALSGYGVDTSTSTPANSGYSTANPTGGVASGTTANNTGGATDNAGTGATGNPNAALTHDSTGAEAAHTHAAGSITEPNVGAGHSHGVTVTPTTHAAGGAHTHNAHSAHSGADVGAHDTLSAAQPYFALAFVQRMS